MDTSEVVKEANRQYKPAAKALKKFFRQAEEQMADFDRLLERNTHHREKFMRLKQKAEQVRDKVSKDMGITETTSKAFEGEEKCEDNANRSDESSNSKKVKHGE